MKNKFCVAVTGCAGFIGSNLTKTLKSKYPGVKIVGIDDLSTGRKSAIDESVVFYEGSITDSELVEKIFDEHKPEYVFHFAALPRVSYSVEEPVLTSEVNILGTVTLLQAASKHKAKRFIYSSSSSVYGGAKILPTKESENFPDPKSPYAIQKYIGESFCKVFSEIYGLETICLRYFNVYGPGQFGDSPYSTVISAWLEALYFPDNKTAFIEGDGSRSRDFCYIDNVVQANILAMECSKKLKGEAINVAHGEQTTVNEVRKLIEEITGKDLKLEQRPPRIGDVDHTCADIEQAKKLIGYSPSINFEDGLKLAVEWYKSRKS